MNEISGTEFRSRFSELTEPTTVKRYSTEIGQWYPTGTASDSGCNHAAEIADLRKQIEYLENDNSALKRSLANYGPNEAGLVEPEVSSKRKKSATLDLNDIPAQERGWFAKKMGLDKKK